MDKLDLTRLYPDYFKAGTKPVLVQLGKAQYLSLTGKGDPSAPDFAERVQALYSVAYAIKFNSKQAGKDFAVPKLEGLWWFDETRFPDQTISAAPQNVPRSEWEYRVLIRMPDFVQEADLQLAKHTVYNRKKLNLARDIEWFEMNEGLCVQILHVGPFSTEPASLTLMENLMEMEGLVRNGPHHEIYLSDFNKTDPDKLKTILREPVRKKN